MKKLRPWHELPPGRLAMEIPTDCHASRERACRRIYDQAVGESNDPLTRWDGGQRLLREIEASGTANNRILRIYLNLLWNSKSKDQEARLNRFLIRLGRALAATKKRKKLPDWAQLSKTDLLLVEGWCRSIFVDGELWPPLCCLTHGAILKFFKLCKRPLATKDSDNTFRQRIQRLGLVGMPKGRIKHVEKRFGVFRFG